MTERSPTFALLGAAGFVAPRHIDAVRAIGGRLVAACDPHDAVGVLDRYGEDVAFHRGEYVGAALPRTDYVVVATPNHLHYGHCREAMERGSDVICEKPVTTTLEDLDMLARREAQFEWRIWPLLQLRLHPAVLAWREQRVPTGQRHQVSVDYVTPRGPWYAESWKGDESRSGGIATNLGIHLFDLLIHLFGEVTEIGAVATECGPGSRWMTGTLALARADVRWRLSTVGAQARRVLDIDGEQIDLSDGFTGLHTAVYREILSGRWYGLADARPAVALCESLRESLRPN